MLEATDFKSISIKTHVGKKEVGISPRWLCKVRLQEAVRDQLDIENRIGPAEWHRKRQDCCSPTCGKGCGDPSPLDCIEIPFML